MGKGGAALPDTRLPAPTHERSFLANTIAQPNDEITKRSVRECIPAHCFKRSYTHSLGMLAWDVIVVFFSFIIFFQCTIFAFFRRSLLGERKCSLR